MQASFSLILNVLLLGVVIAAIVRTVKARKQHTVVAAAQPSLGQMFAAHEDDIIAVRKVDNSEEDIPPTLISAVREPSGPSLKESSDSSIMMFLLAKENRQLAGYELLQTILASGLRFGEGQLFHRHQYPNGQGPIMCSLAAATATGVFDLQNIGAFSVHGLCLFMQACGSPAIDAERLAIMIETGKQLSEGLDAYLLDDRRCVLSEVSLQRYHAQLRLQEEKGEFTV